MATVSDPIENADDDVVADGVAAVAAAAADGPAGRYEAVDCRDDDAVVAAATVAVAVAATAAAAVAAAIAAVDENDGDDDDDGCDDDDFENAGHFADDDENANVAVVFETVEDGREPLSLILTLSPRDLLAILVLPKQVRGPVREVEESEYDWEENPRDDVDALGPRRELGQPRPAAVFFTRLHMYFALLQFIHRHGIFRMSDQRLLKEFGWH